MGASLPKAANAYDHAYDHDHVHVNDHVNANVDVVVDVVVVVNVNVGGFLKPIKTGTAKPFRVAPPEEAVYPKSN